VIHFFFNHSKDHIIVKMAKRLKLFFNNHIHIYKLNSSLMLITHCCTRCQSVEKQRYKSYHFRWNTMEAWILVFNMQCCLLASGLDDKDCWFNPNKGDSWKAISDRPL